MTETTEPAAEIAAAPEADPTATPADIAAKRPPKARRPAPQRTPSPVLERLFQLYPKLFGARFLPLKLGVFQELMENHPEDFKKDELKLALGQHTRSTRYLEAVAAGEKRHGLDGEPASDLAPEHIHHALLEVYRRRQARSKQDLRPWLREQMVRAIEASGLTREAYEELVRSQDEMATAVLQDAFAQMAEVTARREALRRAFQASGKSVEEFADMYGMSPAVVRQVVESGASA